MSQRFDAAEVERLKKLVPLSADTCTALLEELEESKAERVALALSAALSNEGTVKWREKAVAAEAERDRMRELLQGLYDWARICHLHPEAESMKLAETALSDKGVTP